MASIGNVTSFSTLDWYSTASLGMFNMPDGQTLIYGPQVYTSTEQSPVFAPGVFSGADQSSGLTGTLTILTLPQIVNGSFETGIAPGKSTLLLAGDTTSLLGWTVGGTVDIVGTAWIASNGARSVDLSGITPGDISQTVGGLIAGVTYRLTFDLSGSYDSIRTSANNLDVSATGNATQLFTFDKNNTIVEMMYDHLFYDFTATGSSSVIDFAGLDVGDYGAVLDNVTIGLPPQNAALVTVRAASLEAVPEPMSWAMMIVGFGLIGAARRYRRTSQPQRSSRRTPASTRRL